MFEIIPLPQFGVLPVQHNDVDAVTPVAIDGADIAYQVTAFSILNGNVQNIGATDDGPRPPQGK